MVGGGCGCGGGGGGGGKPTTMCLYTKTYVDPCLHSRHRRPMDILVHVSTDHLVELKEF